MFKEKLIPGDLKTLYHRIRKTISPYSYLPVRNFRLYRELTKDKDGIEIGGPSYIFNKELPIYPTIAHLDGCNFSNKTVWEGSIEEGNNYHYFKDRTGYQYICEASDLHDVQSNKYDFLMASHCLEHCANVLKTVREWVRVIKNKGSLLLVLPVKENCFDHNRAVTSFDHLVNDLKSNVDETDLAHLDEILTLHDLSMDPQAGTKEQFIKRSEDNFHNRCLHHHVFDIGLLKKIYSYFNISVLDTASTPYHHIILGVKK